MKSKYLVSIFALTLVMTGCTKKLESENADLKRSLADMAVEKNDLSIRLAKVTAEAEADHARIGDLQKAIEATTAEKNDLRMRLDQTQAAMALLSQKVASIEAGKALAEKEVASLEREKNENQRGEIAGVVSYYFNRNYGYKPDAGATICLFQGKDYPSFNVELMRRYLALKSRAITGDAAAIAAWKNAGDNKDLYLMISSVRAGNDSMRLAADGDGAFRTKVKPGHYSILVTSAHQKQINLTEVGGEISYQELDVTLADPANIDVKF
jgi:hypothetical protein